MAAAVDLFACLGEPLVIAPQSPAQFVPSGIAIHIGDPGVAAIIVRARDSAQERFSCWGIGRRAGCRLHGPVLISVWNRSELGSARSVIEPATVSRN